MQKKNRPDEMKKLSGRFFHFVRTIFIKDQDHFFIFIYT